MIFEVFGIYMGRYGLILCANESYTNNLAIGTDTQYHINSRSTA